MDDGVTLVQLQVSDTSTHHHHHRLLLMYDKTSYYLSLASYISHYLASIDRSMGMWGVLVPSSSFRCAGIYSYMHARAWHGGHNILQLSRRRRRRRLLLLQYYIHIIPVRPARLISSGINLEISCQRDIQRRSTMCDSLFWQSSADQGDLSDVVRASLQLQTAPRHQAASPPYVHLLGGGGGGGEDQLAAVSQHAEQQQQSMVDASAACDLLHALLPPPPVVQVQQQGASRTRTTIEEDTTGDGEELFAGAHYVVPPIKRRYVGIL